MSRQAHAITESVISELRGRKGFGHWWDDIHEEDQAELLACLESRVGGLLKNAEAEDRRDRLDRFLAAALAGLQAHFFWGFLPPKWVSEAAILSAEATLSELERREKGNQ